MLVHVGTLNRMSSRRVKGHIVRRRCNFGGSRVHRSLVDIVPERTKVHVVRATIIEQVGIDSIVALRGGGPDSSTSVVSPRTRLHGRGSGYSNRRIL